MLFTDVVITARVERRLVHGYERYFSMRKTCHESYLDSTEDLALQDIMNRVNQENGKSWKPQTVSTFLARLVKKSFLTVYRKGRYSFYQPAVSKEDFWKATVQENARFFDKGDMAAFACHLCEDALTKEEVQVLKKKLDELN